MRKVLMALVAVFGFAGQAQAMYDGAADWKEPKTVTCMGLPDFPKGYTVEPKDVFGKSLDHYIFSEMDGAMGMYYFDIEHVSPIKMPLKGKVTYIATSDWKVTHYDAKCSFGY